jgi:glutathione S-transferase
VDRRGSYYRWLFFAAGPVESAVTNRALGFTVNDDQKRMAGYGAFDDMYATLIKTVSDASPYLCGDQFTAADVYLGAQGRLGAAVRIPCRRMMPSPPTGAASNPGPPGSAPGSSTMRPVPKWACRPLVVD